MNKHPYTMTLESCVFKCMNNGMKWTCCSWPMKCIFAKTKPSHWMRSKFIDLNCLRLKWGKAIFVIPFTLWNKYIPCYSFFSLNNFSFMKKKSRLGSHPTLGGKRKFQWEKTKSHEKKRGIKAQETQMLGDMSKSLKKWHTR